MKQQCPSSSTPSIPFKVVNWPLIAVRLIKVLYVPPSDSVLSHKHKRLLGVVMDNVNRKGETEWIVVSWIWTWLPDHTSKG